MPSTFFKFMNGVVTLLTLRFGDQKDDLPDAIRDRIPDLKSKTPGETHIIQVTCEKDDLIAYVQLVKNRQKWELEVIADPDYKKGDENHRLIPFYIHAFGDMSRYLIDRPFTHICSVAAQLGDVQFLNPEKGNFTRANVLSYCAMTASYSNWRVARQRVLHWFRIFRNAVAGGVDFSHMPFNADDASLMLDYTYEAHDASLRLDDASGVLREAEENRPKITIRDICIGELMGNCSFIDCCTPDMFDIDLHAVCASNLHDFSMHIIVVFLLRTAMYEVRDKTERDLFHYGGRYESDPLISHCTPLTDRWSQQDAILPPHKVKFFPPDVYKASPFVYETRNCWDALAVLLQFPVFRELWSTEAIRVFFAETLVPSNKQKSVITADTADKLSSYVQRMSPTSTYDKEVNAIIKEYLRRPTCPAKFKKTVSPDLDWAEAIAGNSAHAGELLRIARAIHAERHMTKASPMNARQAVAMVAPRR